MLNSHVLIEKRSLVVKPSGIARPAFGAAQAFAAVEKQVSRYDSLTFREKSFLPFLLMSGCRKACGAPCGMESIPC